MTTIHNADTIKRLLDDARIQTSIDDVPNQLGKTVVPVLIANPEYLITLAENFTRTATGGVTAYTTSAIKKTYLTGALYAIVKDGACDAASGATSITVVVKGETKTVNTINMITATAQNTVSSISFPTPILLDKASIIVLAGIQSFTAGIFSRSLLFFGYEVD